LSPFGNVPTQNSERRENYNQASLYVLRARVVNSFWKVGGTVKSESDCEPTYDGFDGVYLFSSLIDFLAANPNQFRQASETRG